MLSEPSVLSPQSLLRKLRGEVLEKFQAQSAMRFVPLDHVARVIVNADQRHLFWLSLFDVPIR